MLKKKQFNLWLVLIFFLAFFLRFWQLGVNPPALTWDEAAWGYNAYSLGLTGRDEFGRFMPWDYLESFGDFKPPVYAYLTILPVKIFGLNEFAVRFASAFFGVLTVLLAYFLVKELFPANSPRRSPSASSGYHPRCLALPLIASFLLAISPWHLMLSRAAFEANVASFFIIAGVASFLLGIRRKNWFLVLSAICFALSLQTFNTARIVSPLLVLVLAFAFRRQLWLKKKWLILAGGVGLAIILPALSFYFTPQARLRFKEVNIFSDVNLVIQANQEMANDRAWLATLGAEGGFTWWSGVIHNRRWGYTREFFRHYFDHFNPDFLFIKGDGNPKFSTQDVGLFYLWELPFFLGGVFLLFRRRAGYWWLVVFWLLLGIVPAATARETPHALRIESTLPTWQILTAFGVVEFWQLVKRQKKLINYGLRITILGLIVIGFVYFQHGYWRHYPAEFSGEWQYGYKEAINFVKSVENNYDRVYFTDALGRPYIYFLFYLQKDPRQFWQEAEIKRDAYGFVKVRGFGQYCFFNVEARPALEAGLLVVDLPQNLPESAKKVQSFHLLNGQKILVAYEKAYED